MRQRFVDVARPVQRPGKARTRTHVRPGLQPAPELTFQFLELRPERPFAGLHAQPVERDRIGVADRRLVGKQHIGVGAQRRNPDCLAGQADPLGAVRVPGIVHDVLRVIQG